MKSNEDSLPDRLSKTDNGGPWPWTVEGKPITLTFENCFFDAPENEQERLGRLRADAQREHGTVDGKRSCGIYAWRKWLFPKYYIGKCIRCEAIKELRQSSQWKRLISQTPT